MTVAWPMVADGLLELLPTLPGWTAVRVFDGPPLTSSSPDAYCAVGYVRDEGGGGNFERTVGDLDGQLEENGSVRSDVVIRTAQTGQYAAMRTQAFALLGEVDEALHADPTLGGRLDVDSALTVSGDVAPTQDNTGSAARLVLSINYTLRSA